MNATGAGAGVAMCAGSVMFYCLSFYTERVPISAIMVNVQDFSKCAPQTRCSGP